MEQKEEEKDEWRQDGWCLEGGGQLDLGTDSSQDRDFDNAAWAVCDRKEGGDKLTAFCFVFFCADFKDPCCHVVADGALSKVTVFEGLTVRPFLSNTFL